jgi:tRNA-dihydrouridine synthase
VSWKGDKVGVFEMRRHYAQYFRGLPDFKPWRTQLVNAGTPAEVYDVLEQIREVYASIPIV